MRKVGKCIVESWLLLSKGLLVGNDSESCCLKKEVCWGLGSNGTVYLWEMEIRVPRMCDVG